MSTKTDLESILAQVEDLLDEALDPELTREEVIAKVKEAYDLVTGEDTEEEDDDQSGEE